jgi:hypothetical protein
MSLAIRSFYHQFLDERPRRFALDRALTPLWSAAIEGEQAYLAWFGDALIAHSRQGLIEVGPERPRDGTLAPWRRHPIDRMWKLQPHQSADELALADAAGRVCLWSPGRAPRVVWESGLEPTVRALGDGLLLYGCLSDSGDGIDVLCDLDGHERWRSTEDLGFEVIRSGSCLLHLSIGSDVLIARALDDAKVKWTVDLAALGGRGNLLGLVDGLLWMALSPVEPVGAWWLVAVDVESGSVAHRVDPRPAHPSGVIDERGVLHTFCLRHEARFDLRAGGRRIHHRELEQYSPGPGAGLPLITHDGRLVLVDDRAHRQVWIVHPNRPAVELAFQSQRRVLAIAIAYGHLLIVDDANRLTALGQAAE